MNSQYNFTHWVKSNFRYWFSIIYLIIAFVAVVVLVHNNTSKPAPVIEQPAVDLEPLKQQISSLEKQLEQHAKDHKRLESANESLTATVKQLERRAQAQLEYSKRICEYILVITVDKKILPRQCLPEYKWHREEGNGN